MLSSLNASEWYSPARLRRLQAGPLRFLLQHAYAQSPYYRQTFRDRGVVPRQLRTLEDLERLPIISRDVILRHDSTIMARNAQRFHPDTFATGGTTGAPLRFLIDRDTRKLASAVRQRFQRWAGIQPGDRIAEFRHPQSFRHPSGDPDFDTLSRAFPRRNLVRFNTRAIKTDRLAAIAEELSRFRPSAISTNVSPMVALSKYLLAHREYVIRPRVILAGGERLFPEQRQIMSQAFSAPVFETYGNREHVLLGGECERGRLHLAVELSILEIVKDGRPCPPGSMGEVVATNLWNLSFPFIRYAIGDIASLQPDLCPCGRGLPTAQIVGGKILSLLATPQGFIHLSNSVLATPRWRDKIAGIRFYQERRDEVTVQVVRGPSFGQGDEAALVTDLDRVLGSALRIGVQYFDSLEDTPGGKYRYIVSKVPLDLA